MVYPDVLADELLISMAKVCPAVALIALLNEPPPAPTLGKAAELDSPVNPPGVEFANEA